jgi:hypothetical protein
MAVLRLHNPQWDRVTVEVRRGNNNSCDDNTPYQTKQMLRDDTWEIEHDEMDICWRRDVDPDNPDGEMMGWNRQSYLDGDHDVDL